MESLIIDSEFWMKKGWTIAPIARHASINAHSLFKLAAYFAGRKFFTCLL